jgi:hypothetical protein
MLPKPTPYIGMAGTDQRLTETDLAGSKWMLYFFGYHMAPVILQGDYNDEAHRWHAGERKRPSTAARA